MLSSKFASLLFDQIPDRRVVGTDRNTHLLICCINQIVPGFVTYHLNKGGFRSFFQWDHPFKTTAITIFLFGTVV